MRRAAKRDGNEATLAKIPPLYGWTIRKLSDTGKPDWICLRHGRVVFIEIKDEGGTLTPAQEKEFPYFEAAGCPIHVCRTEVDIRRALGLPVEGVLEPLPPRGNLVTPAYQREQTAAVVPPPRLSEAERMARHPGRKPKK